MPCLLTALHILMVDTNVEISFFWRLHASNEQPCQLKDHWLLWSLPQVRASMLAFAEVRAVACSDLSFFTARKDRCREFTDLEAYCKRTQEKVPQLTAMKRMAGAGKGATLEEIVSYNVEAHRIAKEIYGNKTKKRSRRNMPTKTARCQTMAWTNWTIICRRYDASVYIASKNST